VESSLRPNRRSDADIALVGAGPAGAASACPFARAGFDVAVLDQCRFPRDKVCGDFVGPPALGELERLGLASERIFENAARIRGGALYINGKRVVAAPFPHIGRLPDHGLCIPRMLLDEALVKAAVTSGALLIDEARVGIGGGGLIQDDGSGRLLEHAAHVGEHVLTNELRRRVFRVELPLRDLGNRRNWKSRT